jgi:hypothetical protein
MKLPVQLCASVGVDCNHSIVMHTMENMKFRKNAIEHKMWVFIFSVPYV